MGGKSRVASLRDVTYEWVVLREGREAGTARTHLKATGALRTDFLLADGEWDAAANARTAWLRERDGRLSTLTDREAFAAQAPGDVGVGPLRGLQEAEGSGAHGRARGGRGHEPAYAVEFSTRAGARLRYWFDTQSKLLVQSSDEARRTRVRYSDWRAREGSPLKVEPHRIESSARASPPSRSRLSRRATTRGSPSLFFEPPADATLDIPALLRDLSKNQEEADKRINDYTFTRKVTERELNDKGELKKEKVKVYEVYPSWATAGCRSSSARTACRSRRSARRKSRSASRRSWRRPSARRPSAPRSASANAPSAREKRRAKAAVGREGEAEDEDDVEISTFLRACELFSPRRERFRDRDVIVFDFRPRAGFKPSNRGESHGLEAERRHLG